MLERLFFHDILNTAGGLSGLLEILPDLAQEEAAETSQEARFLAEQLIEEIQSQRDLLAAERGELPITPTVIDATEILHQISTLYITIQWRRAKRLLCGREQSVWCCTRMGGCLLEC